MQDINDVYNKARLKVRDTNRFKSSAFLKSLTRFQENGNSFDMHRISSSEYGKKLYLKRNEGELNLKTKYKQEYLKTT
jgi:hypothetical protein